MLLSHLGIATRLHTGRCSPWRRSFFGSRSWNSNGIVILSGLLRDYAAPSPKEYSILLYPTLTSHSDIERLREPSDSSRLTDPKLHLQGRRHAFSRSYIVCYLRWPVRRVSTLIADCCHFDGRLLLRALWEVSKQTIATFNIRHKTVKVFILSRTSHVFNKHSSISFHMISALRQSLGVFLDQSAICL